MLSHSVPRLSALGFGALALFSGCDDPASAGYGPPPIPPVEWSFGADAVGAVPKGFSAQSGTWEVVSDPTAPGDRQAVAQTASSEASAFNVLLLDAPQYRDVSFVVSLCPVEGIADQGGGLVWRARDERNYYVARYNPLEKNFRLYAVVDGERKQLASAKLELKPGWHNVAVQMKADAIECFLDGRSYLKANDATFAEAGRIGLWTKADARTHFDDFKARPFN